MSIDLILTILAGVCGVAAIVDRDHPWAGIGVLVLAIALVV